MEIIPKQRGSNTGLNNPQQPVRALPIPQQKVSQQIIPKQVVTQQKKEVSELSVRDYLKRLEDKIDYGQKRGETKKEGKLWRFPFRWKRMMNQSLKKQAKDKVLCFYLNKKNEIEQPKLLPIYSGNMVIYKNTPYEMDPRAVWTMRSGRKFYKVMIIKEIDRRPVSNLDYTEIKRRGDATDSDEFLIKAALRAQQHKLTRQQVSRGVIIFVIIAVVGGVIWFMSR